MIRDLCSCHNTNSCEALIFIVMQCLYYWIHELSYQENRFLPFCVWSWGNTFNVSTRDAHQTLTSHHFVYFSISRLKWRRDLCYLLLSVHFFRIFSLVITRGVYSSSSFSFLIVFFLPKYLVVWWLSGYGIRFGTERSQLRLPASPLSSNNSGQVVHTYVPVWVHVV